MFFRQVLVHEDRVGPSLVALNDGFGHDSACSGRSSVLDELLLEGCGCEGHHYWWSIDDVGCVDPCIGFLGIVGWLLCFEFVVVFVALLHLVAFVACDCAEGVEVVVG